MHRFEVADGVEADLAPGSKTITFDDLGHFMQLEDPTLLTRTIVDFLTA